MEISILDVLFGIFEIDDDFLLINHISVSLLAKFYMHRCKLGNTKPSIQAKLRATYNVECCIPKENGAVLKNLDKWKSFQCVLS